MRKTVFVSATLIVSGLLSACAPQSEARLMPGTATKYTTSKSASSKASVRSSARSVALSSSSSSVSSVAVPLKNWSIPILVYHHIRKQEGWSKETWSWKMTVTPQTFEKQMQWLADHQYTPVSLDTFVQIVKGERTGPQKPVVITFDDSNLNQYDVAVPILEKHYFTGVFYLITKYLDSPSMINRERVLDMQKRGMDIENHTVDHDALAELSDSRLDYELTESKRVLEELLGHPIHHLAYPLVSQNARVREHMAKAGYWTGTTMDPRNANETDSLLKLPRIMMTDDTNLQSVLP